MSSKRPKGEADGPQIVQAEPSSRLHGNTHRESRQKGAEEGS